MKTASSLLRMRALPAHDVVHDASIARISCAGVPTEARDTGLGSLAGGDAHLPDEGEHDDVFKRVVGEGRSLAVHRTAHDLGTFANTRVLCGRIDTHEECTDQLLQLRERSDQSLPREDRDQLGEGDDRVAAVVELAYGLDVPLKVDGLEVRPEKYAGCVITAAVRRPVCPASNGLSCAIHPAEGHAEASLHQPRRTVCVSRSCADSGPSLGSPPVANALLRLAAKRAASLIASPSP